MLLWQCAIPVFEGLLPSPHNGIVMTLLYRLAEWHALAKLRMHTDDTLSLLDTITAILGHQLRQFRRIVCSAYSTKDLPKEKAARQRKKQRDQAKAATNTASSARGSTSKAAKSSSTQTETSQPNKPGKLVLIKKIRASQLVQGKRRMFSLWTYKLHSLGDYARTIRALGTTDSYSTQTVRLLRHH